MQLAKALAKLRDDSTAPGELVAIIDELENNYGFADDIPGFMVTGKDPKFNKFIAAGGIDLLVQIATTGWPADGNLAASKHRYDIVTDVGDAAIEHEFDPQEPFRGGKKPGPKWRSIRRKAIVCCATMGHYTPYLDAMERAGLFAQGALPAMLESSFAHVDYSLHNKGWEFIYAKDQTQPVVVNLLNLTASAINISTVLLDACRKHTGLSVCRLYKDPFMLWVDKCHADREGLAARYRAKGWSEDRINSAVHDVKQRQQQLEDRFGTGEFFFELGGMDFNIVRFYTTLIKRCSDEELLQLIHQGGLITRLKGCQSHAKPNRSRDSPDEAIDILTELWTKKAADVSKDIYKQIEEEEARSLSLREKGNDAFKAGMLQQALDSYWQAVQHNPQDYSLFNNISLVALRHGNAKQAIRAAEESIRLAPTVYKSWCRLGDAFKSIQRWQLAHLCYTCANELAPHDEDVKARREEARSHLAKVWSVEEVPRFGQDRVLDGSMDSTLEAFRWMGLSDPTELMHVLMGSRDEAGSATAVLNKFESQSRFWASTHLKGEIEDARALAVASGVVRASDLQPGCARLKQPRQLPQLPEEWQISWTDTPMRHKQTGLIRHMLMIMTTRTGATKATIMTLGTPGLNSVRRVIMSAMLNPLDGNPGRPTALFVAHRLFPLVHKMCQLCQPWGIVVSAETISEAQQTAKNQDTSWDGYNHEGEYLDEEEEFNMTDKKMPDPGNGHKRE